MATRSVDRGSEQKNRSRRKYVIMTYVGTDIGSFARIGTTRTDRWNSAGYPVIRVASSPWFPLRSSRQDHQPVNVDAVFPRGRHHFDPCRGTEAGLRSVTVPTTRFGTSSDGRSIEHRDGRSVLCQIEQIVVIILLSRASIGPADLTTRRVGNEVRTALDETDPEPPRRFTSPSRRELTLAGDVR